MPDTGWWLVARTPDGIHLYPLTATYDTDAWADPITAAKAELGPPENWVDDPGWDFSVQDAPLHHTITTGATVHDGTVG